MDNRPIRLYQLAYRVCFEDLPNYYHHKYDHPLTPEEVEDLSALTFFKGWGIYRAFDFFAFTTRNKKVSPRTSLWMENDTFFRRVPSLWISPFQERFEKIFSYNHYYMTFDDCLDMMNALSDNCPKSYKAEVAFQIYDFDDDGLISLEDIIKLLKALTDGKLDEEDYTDAANIVLEYGDRDKDGYLGLADFKLLTDESQDFPDLFHLSTRLVRDLRGF